MDSNCEELTKKYDSIELKTPFNPNPFKSNTWCQKITKIMSKYFHWSLKRKKEEEEEEEKTSPLLLLVYCCLNTWKKKSYAKIRAYSNKILKFIVNFTYRLYYYYYFCHVIILRENISWTWAQLKKWRSVVLIHKPSMPWKDNTRDLCAPSLISQLCFLPPQEANLLLQVICQKHKHRHCNHHYWRLPKSWLIHHF